MKRNSYILFLSLFLLICVTPFVDAQINKLGKKSTSFSSAGNKWSRIRQGVLFSTGFDLNSTMLIGVGYAASQYHGVGNLYMQQSVSYQFGFLERTHHSFEASIHSNFFGGLDFSPAVWGGNLMFVKEGDYGQLFIRPDIGVMYPFSYRARAAENKKLTIMLLYGYNFKLFERRDNLGINSHYISLKLLYTFWTYHDL